MYAHSCCRSRGTRCESGTAPQRCAAYSRGGPRVRVPADSVPAPPRRGHAHQHHFRASRAGRGRIARDAHGLARRTPLPRTARPPIHRRRPPPGEKRLDHRCLSRPARPGFQLRPRRPDGRRPGRCAPAPSHRPQRRPSPGGPRSCRRRRAPRPPRRLGLRRAARPGRRRLRVDDRRGPAVLEARGATARAGDRRRGGDPGRGLVLHLDRRRPRRGPDR